MVLCLYLPQSQPPSHKHPHGHPLLASHAHSYALDKMQYNLEGVAHLPTYRIRDIWVNPYILDVLLSHTH